MRRSYMGFGALAVLAWATAGAAAAQSQNANDAVAEEPAATLGDIVVTAQRVGQRLQDVPVSVSAISSETMDRMQVSNVADVMRLVPNVKFDSGTSGTSSLKPYIRGGGMTDGPMVTSESEVAIYIDDVYRARLAGAMMDFVELQRIEVLRGPQGSLYGRNSSAGAVNIITKGPSADPSGTVTLGLGSWDERRLRGYFSTPLTEDGNWRGSLNGMIRARSGGKQYNVTQGRGVGEEEFVGVQGDLAYVGDTLNARLSVSFTDSESDGQWAVSTIRDANGKIVPRYGSYRIVGSPIDGFSATEQQSATLRVSKELGNHTLTSITGWSTIDEGWRQDFSGGVPASELGMGSGVLALMDRTSYSNQEQYSQELQLSGNLLNDKLQYVSGVYLFREEGWQNLSTITYFAPSYTEFDVETESYALYVHGTYNLTDKLSATVGLRYTSDDKTLDAEMNGTDVERSDSFSQFTSKFGVNYKVNDNILTYVSYSEGFKGGGYNAMAANAAQLDTPFKQQLTKALEAGIKSDLFDRRVRLNLSVFQNDIENRQQIMPVDNGFFIVENYDVEIRGIELEGSWLVNSDLTLWGNAAFNGGEYKGTVGSLIGKELPSLPDYQYAIGLDYSRQVGPGQFLFGADWSHRESFFAAADNALIGLVEPHDILNAYIGYELDRWKIQLSAKNLTQQEGWHTAFGFSQVQPRHAIEPMNYMMTLRYRY
jgi:iron complex outermembrane receptor protein